MYSVYEWTAQKSWKKKWFCDISLMCFFYWALNLQFPSKERRKYFVLWVKSRQKATDRLWCDRHSRSVRWGSKCWACAQGHRKSRRCWSHTPEQTQPQHLFHWLTATANTEQNAKYLPSLHGFTGLSEKHRWLLKENNLTSHHWHNTQALLIHTYSNLAIWSQRCTL